MKKVQLIANANEDIGFEELTPVMKEFDLDYTILRPSDLASLMFKIYKVNGGVRTAIHFYNTVLSDIFASGFFPAEVQIPIKFPMDYPGFSGFVNRHFEGGEEKTLLFQHLFARAIGQKVEVPEYSGNIIHLSEILHTAPQEALELCVKKNIPFQEWVEYERIYAMLPGTGYPEMKDVVKAIPELRNRVNQWADDIASNEEGETAVQSA